MALRQKALDHIKGLRQKRKDLAQEIKAATKALSSGKTRGPRKPKAESDNGGSAPATKSRKKK